MVDAAGMSLFEFLRWPDQPAVQCPKQPLAPPSFVCSSPGGTKCSFSAQLGFGLWCRAGRGLFSASPHPAPEAAAAIGFAALPCDARLTIQVRRGPVLFVGRAL